MNIIRRQEPVRSNSFSRQPTDVSEMETDSEDYSQHLYSKKMKLETEPNKHITIYSQTEIVKSVYNHLSQLKKDGEVDPLDLFKKQCLPAQNSTERGYDDYYHSPLGDNFGRFLKYDHQKDNFNIKINGKWIKMCKHFPECNNRVAKDKEECEVHFGINEARVSVLTDEQNSEELVLLTICNDSWDKTKAYQEYLEERRDKGKQVDMKAMISYVVQGQDAGKLANEHCGSFKVKISFFLIL